MEYDIKLNGGEEAAKLFEDIGEGIWEVLQHELHEFMLRIVDEARSNLQNHANVVTGNLLSSIKILEEGDLEGKVGTTEEYAVYIEYGRGIVKPVTKKVLHWIDPHTGEDVFAMKAKEFPASPFFEPAVITQSEKFADYVDKAIGKFLKDLGVDSQ